MRSLSEATVLITGSTRGVGKTIAEYLQAKTAGVVGHGRRPGRKDVGVDLGTERAADDLWAAATERLDGPPTILILNAGSATLHAPLVLDGEDVRVNFSAPARLLDLSMQTPATQRVVYISSGGAATPAADLPAYCAAKALMETYIRHRAPSALPSILSVLRVDTHVATDMCEELHGAEERREAESPACILPLLLGILQAGLEASGRVYSLRSARANLCLELLLSPVCVSGFEEGAFAESDLTGATYVVNGDVSASRDRYPSVMEEEKLCAQLAGHDECPQTCVLPVQGGVSGCFELICRVLLRPNDEVVFHGAVFPAFEAMLRRNGHPVRYALPEGSGFELHVPWKNTASLISPRTRLVLISQPSYLFCTDTPDLTELIESVGRRAVVLLDECYLPFLSSAVNAGQYIASRDVTVVGMRSLSKMDAMPGLRLGYIVCPTPLCSLLAENRAFKSIPTLSLQRAVDYLATNARQNTKRSFLTERAYIRAAGRKAGVKLGGRGPYVLVPEAPPLADLHLLEEELRGRKILTQRVGSCIVYCVSSRRWNAAFVQALEAAKA